MAVSTDTHRRTELGLRVNIQQFSLLVLINAFVGGMVGIERTILPLIAEQEFGLASKSAILSFIVSFGIVKAITNLLAGRYSDLIGRKKLLVTGWLLGLLTGSIYSHVGSDVGLGYCRQSPARHQSGLMLVHYRDYEDRPCGTQAAWICDGA